LLWLWFGRFAKHRHCHQRNKSNYKGADSKTFKRCDLGRTLRPSHVRLHHENLILSWWSVNAASH